MMSSAKPEWITFLEARNIIQHETLQPFSLTDKILEDAMMRGNVEVMGVSSGEIVSRIVTLDELQKCEIQSGCLWWKKPSYYMHGLSGAFDNIVVNYAALKAYVRKYRPKPQLLGKANGAQKLPVISTDKLQNFLKKVKTENRKTVPSQKVCEMKAKQHFQETGRVVRGKLRKAHEHIFGKQSPGPRKNIEK